jgi:hypothetical protein
MNTELAEDARQMLTALQKRTEKGAIFVRGNNTADIKIQDTVVYKLVNTKHVSRQMFLHTASVKLREFMAR